MSWMCRIFGHDIDRRGYGGVWFCKRCRTAETEWTSVRHRLRKWLCRVIGHRLNLGDLEYGGYSHCDRCGAHSYELLPQQWVWTYRWWWNIGRWWRQRNRKCSDCGKLARNGNHDDCCPF